MSTETIWTLLKKKGFTDAATAALMGQMNAESSCIACRLQGDFSAGYSKSKTYTEQVDNGQISRYDFARKGPGGGGYGLCQWTFYARKEGLYDKAKSMGLSIGSEEVQIEWLWDELNQAEYRNVFNQLKNNASSRDDISNLSEVLTRHFEKPAIQNATVFTQRSSFAKNFYNMYAGKATANPEPATPVKPTVTKPDTPTTPFWPPRMLTKGMVGSDVGVLQALLIARGYDAGEIDGMLGEQTKKAMWEFQKKSGMATSGDFGPKSWALLLKQ